VAIQTRIFTLVNLIARGLDLLDRTRAFYSNVMVVARKPEGPVCPRQGAAVSPRVKPPR
jgi:hypothetical protein